MEHPEKKACRRNFVLHATSLFDIDLQQNIFLLVHNLEGLFLVLGRAYCLTYPDSLPDVPYVQIQKNELYERVQLLGLEDHSRGLIRAVDCLQF